MTTPVRARSFVFYLGLVDTNNRPSFKSSPTISAGDFKVSTDGSAYANLTNLPTVTPAGSESVRVALTAAEMTGAEVNVMASDQAGAEWDDVFVTISVTSASIDDVYTDTQYLTGTVGTIATDVDFVRSMTAGRWKIDTTVNQMIFYEEDNATEVARFNLLDTAGSPTSTCVAERTKV